MSNKDSRQTRTGKCQITRQRKLLLEKLEDFRRINKSVRQKLKQLQEAEVGHIIPYYSLHLNYFNVSALTSFYLFLKTVQTVANQQIDMLMKKITQAESENEVSVLSNLKAKNLLCKM